MYISFYIDDEFYSGEAEPIEKDLETQFRVDLGDKLNFTIFMSTNGHWASDDLANTEIVSATGSEIERHDDAFRPEPIQPGKYYSSTVSNGVAPVVVDGEIVNEPEDVDEQSDNLKNG